MGIRKKNVKPNLGEIGVARMIFEKLKKKHV